jgi:Transposase DDE domain
MTGYTDEIEKALFLRRFGVPFWGLTYVFGRDDMYWERIELHLGHSSLAGTTVKHAEQLPQDVLADEKHTRLNGDKVYVATTVGSDGVLGASGALQADAPSLQEAYGQFKAETRNLSPDYQPHTVNTDGWKATQTHRRQANNGGQVAISLLTIWEHDSPGNPLGELTMTPDLGTFAPMLQTFFTQTADQVARTAGFVERVSKLTGALFLQTLVLGFLEHPDASLNGLTDTSRDLGVNLTKQSLQGRIENAVGFLTDMFQQALALFRNELPLDLQVLQQFTAIFLTDSSTVAVPDLLKDEFPGCGGDGPDAAIKIQLTFEFLRGVMAGIRFQAGRTPDQSYTGELERLLAGALYLSDLGYFLLSRFRRIDAAHAYFLSRFDLHTALFTADGTALDLLEWLRAHAEPRFEESVRIGRQEQLPCRMVVVRVPQEVADERRRKARETARRKGRTPSARHLALMDWTIYITNVPATRLTLRQVVILYSVRWQIELIFKLWKSECNLDRVAGRHRERVLSELYAKLIGMVIMQFVLAPFRNGERELSVVKVVRLIQHHVRHVIEHLGDREQLAQVLQDLAQRFLESGMKDKRQRLTTLQAIHATEDLLA